MDGRAEGIRGGTGRWQGRRPRLLAALLLLLGIGGLLGLAAEGQENGPSRTMAGSLAGQLLVATEEIGDPRFARSVIYLIHHDRSGAMGLIVNQPMGAVPLAELLADLGLEAGEATGRVRLHAGGPVEPGRGLVLHTRDYAAEGSLPAGEGLALTVDSRILRLLGTPEGPRLFLVTFGYAGWGPGQLEGEMGRGSWIAVPADEALIFDAEDGTKWERARARRLFRL